MRDLPGSRTLCLIIIQGDLPGARTLCLMNTKEGCLTPPGTLRIWQNVGDLRGKKVWYILPVPGRFLENMGIHVLFKKVVPHTTRQLSGLWKNWAPSVDFFMAITLTMPMICSLIEHGFLPVFSIERKVMLYSNLIYWSSMQFPPKFMHIKTKSVMNTK